MDLLFFSHVLIISTNGRNNEQIYCMTYWLKAVRLFDFFQFILLTEPEKITFEITGALKLNPVRSVNCILRSDDVGNCLPYIGNLHIKYKSHVRGNATISSFAICQIIRCDNFCLCPFAHEFECFVPCCYKSCGRQLNG